jgi:predicted transposase YbfD/YdcC
LPFRKHSASTTESRLIELFEALPERRVKRTRAYSLAEILFLVVAAAVSGVNTLTGIEDFGQAKLEWFRTILPYKSGIPSHDTIGRVLGMLDPDALQKLFVEWMQETSRRVKGGVAIDGKTLRGAIRPGDSKSFVHMVTAFGAANGVVYGSEKTDEKSNEITAIPRLLKLLHLDGAIITMDAMGCQTAILEEVVERKGNYVVAVKSNQPTLADDISIAFSEADRKPAARLITSSKETDGRSHGRGEKRRCEVIDAQRWISDQKKWKTVRSLVRVVYERRLQGRVTEDVRYFVSSIAGLTATDALAITRTHWAIENKLHWVLDVVFQEDRSRVWAENAAENLARLRHFALNMLRAADALPKKGISGRRNLAAWSDSARELILSSFPAE